MCLLGDRKKTCSVAKIQLTNHLTDSTQIRAHAKSLSTACYGNYRGGKREEEKEEEGNNRKAVASMPALLLTVLSPQSQSRKASASVSVTCWTLVDIEIIRAHVSVTPRWKEGDEMLRFIDIKSGRPTS